MDAIELLMQDHRQVEDLFALLRQAPDPAARKDVAIRLVALVARHDAAEVQVLYPALRDVKGITEDQVNEALNDHREARDALAELDARTNEVMTEDFMERWGEFEADLTAHVKEEEDVLFPLLRAASTRAQLEELGQQLEVARDGAPTHPHLSTPDNPAVATVMGSAMGLVDRVRDAVTGETEQRKAT